MLAPRIKDIGIYCAGSGLAIAVFWILFVTQFEMAGTIYANPWLVAILGIPMFRGGSPMMHTINAVILMWPAFLCWFLVIRRSGRKPSPLRTVVSFVAAVLLAHLLIQAAYARLMHTDTMLLTGFSLAVICGYPVLDRWIYAKPLFEVA